MKLKFLTSVAVVMLSACASCPTVPPESVQAGELLDYFGRAAVLPVEEQRRAFQLAEEEFQRSAGDLPRLRLAMMLSLPRVPWRDDARLLSLLSPYESLPEAYAERPVQEIGMLLHGQALERVRLQRADQRRLEVAVREEQRRMENVLREEQRRNDELKQKLDALRSIDRELRSRRP